MRLRNRKIYQCENMEGERRRTFSEVAQTSMASLCCVTAQDHVASLKKIIELLNKDLMEAQHVIGKIKSENTELLNRLATLEHNQLESRRTNYSGHSRPNIQSSEWQKPKKSLHTHKVTPNQGNGVQIRNSFEILGEENEPNLTSDIGDPSQSQINSSFSAWNQRTKKSPTPQKNKARIHVYSDSHGRGLRNKVAEVINNAFVCGYVKPGASMPDIVRDIDTECKTLSKKDCTVIFGGTNSVAKKQDREVVYCLKRTLPSLSQTNVIVIDIPVR